MSNYPSVVKRIHNEFNTAGENLLAQAKEIINGKELLADKAARLQAMGFNQANEVERWNSIKINKELAELIRHYQISYPNNKFITEEQVALINKKYNLICAPIDRYKGFVPNCKLKQIESFSIKEDDLRENFAKINSFSTSNIDSEGIRQLKIEYPNLIIPLRHITRDQIKGFGGYMGYIGVSQYSIIKNTGLFICAPKKDLNIKWLSKIGSLFTSLTKITVPDPVVLHPCKGGYLIVAAWGDEASDEIVVNQKQN